MASSNDCSSKVCFRILILITIAMVVSSLYRIYSHSSISVKEFSLNFQGVSLIQWKSESVPDLPSRTSIGEQLLKNDKKSKTVAVNTEAPSIATTSANRQAIQRVEIDSKTNKNLIERQTEETRNTSKTRINTKGDKNDNNTTHIFKISEERNSNSQLSTVIKVRPRALLCPYEGGRLGNMLFNFASTYCIAKKMDRKLVLPAKYKLYNDFKLTPVPVSNFQYYQLCSTTKNKNIRRINIKTATKYVNISLPGDNDVILYGYFQSWRFFDECKEDIRKQLTFKDEHLYRKAEDRLKRAAQKLKGEKILEKYVTIVGIHVRRGDFRKYNNPVGTKSYFQKAREYFRNTSTNVVFVVITDPNPETRLWCKENIVTGSNDTVLLEEAGPLVDLATMWSCDHVIISVGTFSWWSGWMNSRHGTVVYYQAEIWRNKNKDYVLPNWIGISD